MENLIKAKFTGIDRIQHLAFSKILDANCMGAGNANGKKIFANQLHNR